LTQTVCLGDFELTVHDMATQILRSLGDSEGVDVTSLKSKLHLSEPVLPILLWLGSMNFVVREEVTARNPIIRALWRVTAAGKAYLSYIDSHGGLLPYASVPIQVLLVAPMQLRSRLKGVSTTDIHETLVDILASAKNEVLISSPYIDEVIVPLLLNVPQRAKIRILTEDANKPFLRRIVESRPKTEVRYLRVFDKSVQLFQVHAKFACVDRATAIVTSANVNERSMFHNVEVGVLVSDPKVCANIADVFDGIFDQASRQSV